jgi:RNA polymerase sigma-70 factor (ECF subfamily)
MDGELRRRPIANSAAPAPVTTSVDDRELVAAVLRKDRKAAAQLVAAHIDAIYAYVRHRLPQSDLVDDVVQEVFLAALNGLATFQGTSSLRGWLVGIARHKADDLYRQRLRASEPLPENDSTDEQPATDGRAIDEMLDSDRVRAKARTILARMPERYALMLLWRYWEQRSTRDIAVALGTTEKSIERTLARARASFKQRW